MSQKFDLYEPGRVQITTGLRAGLTPTKAIIDFLLAIKRVIQYIVTSSSLP